MRQRTVLTVAAGVMLAAMLAVPVQAADLRTMFVGNLKDAQEKILALAEAIPEDKYGWRPAEGVRSVSEVLMHLAGGNYMMGRGFGVEAPADARGLEQNVTAKTEVIARLKASFAALGKGIASADLDQPTQLFGGREGTLADMALILVAHAHEHLGQLIAYARSNGVVPPWSQ